MDRVYVFTVSVCVSGCCGCCCCLGVLWRCVGKILSDCHEKADFDLSLRPLAGFLPRGVETTCVRVSVGVGRREGVGHRCKTESTG